jgi:serine/threonine-protein kinase
MIGQLLAGRYQLQDLAGRGGMSSVYRARDSVLERTVAIKILHEHF